ncbi:unnamed protein product [Clonostachys chloroleuca]|uniref:Uncharacterized protein n=1 Tax=Clonostachys chloroleuca TaxID=1926264 RepID=A0AA35LTJ7_9HYPO|nr:unnamed protein product [Clonostachys chloroleuca]
MPIHPVPSSSNLSALADSLSTWDPVVNEITPESRVSTCSTLVVDVGSEASAESNTKRDPVVDEIMPASRVSSSSTMPVDVVSKASALRWGGWDPTNHWIYHRKREFFLAAGPQGGYRFPQYLGYADSGSCRVGAVFSSLNDLDAILVAPKVMPDDCIVFLSGARTFHDRNLTSSPFSSLTAVRKFSFQQLEHHLISPSLLNSIINKSVWNKVKPDLWGRRRIYIITGLRIAKGLEVSDGESCWKFKGQVIFSYRMHELKPLSETYDFRRVYPRSEDKVFD